MLMWYLSTTLSVPWLLLSSVVVVQSVAAVEDVLLRSDAQWESLEAIHRRGIDVRISQVADRGTFDTTVNLGYGGAFNWVDVWGPTYICPTMEHFGTIGDGGKWVVGVETMLQRANCIIYSFGSLSDFSFEQEMLARTKCEIHVFDPTVKPSDMRQREADLNGSGPKRVTWYSVGVSDVDDDSSTLLPQCYGGANLLHASSRKTLSSSQGAGRKLLGGFTLPRLWRPPEEPEALTATSSNTLQSNTEAVPITVGVTTEAGQAEAIPVPPVAPVPPPPVEPVQTSPRDAAVQEVIGGLQEERVRINSTADACGVAAHKEGGIAPLPQGEVEAGQAIDFSEGPHGDTRTTCRLATLPSLMKSLGHEWVDVLKIDIEGSEYATLGFIAGLPGDAMRFTQLQLEMHHMWAPDPTQPNVAQYETLRQLLSHGYRTTFLEPNIYFAAQTCHELAFIKMDDCGNVVTPPLAPEGDVATTPPLTPEGEAAANSSAAVV